MRVIIFEGGSPKGGKDESPKGSGTGGESPGRGGKGDKGESPKGSGNEGESPQGGGKGGTGESPKGGGKGSEPGPNDQKEGRPGGGNTGLGTMVGFLPSESGTDSYASDELDKIIGAVQAETEGTSKSETGKSGKQGKDGGIVFIYIV